MSEMTTISREVNSATIAMEDVWAEIVYKSDGKAEVRNLSENWFSENVEEKYKNENMGHHDEYQRRIHSGFPRKNRSNTVTDKGNAKDSSVDYKTQTSTRKELTETENKTPFNNCGIFSEEVEEMSNENSVSAIKTNQRWCEGNDSSENEDVNDTWWLPLFHEIKNHEESLKTEVNELTTETQTVHRKVEEQPTKQELVRKPNKGPSSKKYEKETWLNATKDTLSDQDQESGVFHRNQTTQHPTLGKKLRKLIRYGTREICPNFEGISETKEGGLDNLEKFSKNTEIAEDQKESYREHVFNIFETKSRKCYDNLEMLSPVTGEKILRNSWVSDDTSGSREGNVKSKWAKLKFWKTKDCLIELSGTRHWQQVKETDSERRGSQEIGKEGGITSVKRIPKVTDYYKMAAKGRKT